jgi:hypothetical protein
MFVADMDGRGSSAFEVTASVIAIEPGRDKRAFSAFAWQGIDVGTVSRESWRVQASSPISAFAHVATERAFGFLAREAIEAWQGDEG